MRSAIVVAVAGLAMTGCSLFATRSAPGISPIRVTEAQLADCPELTEPKSPANEHVVPAYVDAVKKFNECAADKAALAAKVREHNNKAENKNKNENADGESP